MNRRVETNNKSNIAAKRKIDAANLLFSKFLTITITIILTLAVLAWLGYRALHTYEQFMAINKVHHGIIETNGVITHLDEVLTMSAKMAAATGNLKWEDRYRSFETKLDAAIKKVMKMSPEKFINKSAAQTDLANTKLVAIENEAFGLVRKGNLKAASELLDSQEYEKQKRIYSQGIKQCADALERYMEVESERNQNATIKRIIIVSFSTILAACSVLGILQMRKRLNERKRAEESVEKAYKELKKSHQELKDVQSQLFQSEKLAAIGQLAAGVAHELNTPVGFVAGNFQTLERHVKKILDLLTMHDKLAGQDETSGNPQLKTIVDDIYQFRDDMQIDFILEDIQRLFVESKEGVGRTIEIVQNLRDFSRIDQPGSRDEYDLNEGIKATLVMASNEIKYDADIKTDFSELPLIYCHCGQINQVLLNILVNAAQAIKSQEREDRGTITIKTYASDDGAACEISDDGPGIAPENVSKVFDPFFTTKPIGKGTGLGLNVSYGIIVNKHNGELLVDSTVGEGTTFTIKLPKSTKENEEEKEIISNGKKDDSIIC